MSTNPIVKIVSATRLSELDFWNTSALGLSLRRLDSGRYKYGLAFDNGEGLPHIYNHFILENDACEIILFVHDDVWIDDYFLLDRLVDALQVYDVVGVAGNTRRIPFQPAWGFVDIDFTWDRDHLSGAIAEGQGPGGVVHVGGVTPAACELLDGVFLAVRKSVLLEKRVFFDPRFDFHFYDMDFCRTARANGLRLGTWPICLTHQGKGLFGTPQWREKYKIYIQKWGS